MDSNEEAVLLADVGDNRSYSNESSIVRKSTQIEGLDYVTCENDFWDEDQKNVTALHDKLEEVGRWILSFFIGLATGIVALFIQYCVEHIFDVKYGVVNQYLDIDINDAFLIYLAINVALCLGASTIIVFLEPAASGSGIPEVKGYLNGSRIPKAFNIRTMAVKIVSVILSVSSSLPVGPEGPLIHIGGIIGGGIGEGRSRTLKCSIPLMNKFRNSVARRDFISSGAAAGVSAAFGSPIGGILFALEEASSFWSQRLTLRTFFGCMVATLTARVFKPVVDGEHISWISSAGSAVFYTGDMYNYHYFEFVGFIVMGLIGGLGGALFTFIGLKITRWRIDFLHKKRWRRIVEVVVLVIAVSTIMFYMCKAFPCRPNPYNDATNSTIPLQRFTCPEGYYNELATLFLDRQENGVKQLFTHQDDVFGSLSTITFSLIYFVLSALVSGSTLSTGLMVPMMLIGAGYGRSIGYLFNTHVSTIFHPGTYAIVGAASFMAGVTRGTISLVVIFIEITNNLGYLLPFMISIMVAKWVGDLFTHPFYDAILEQKKITFLESEPSNEMNKMKTQHVGSAPVVCLSAIEKVEKIVKILRQTTHNGFPVVKDGEVDHKILGVIIRRHLLTLLKIRAYETDHQMDMATWKEALHSKYTDIEDIYVSEAGMRSSIDLRPYMNHGPVIVHKNMSVTLAFRLFRTMGLRHLPVVDSNNDCIAMITRKDLTEHAIHQKYHELKDAGHFDQIL